MVNLNKFEDFLFNKLFEDSKELFIVFSDRLIKLLKNIDHPVAKELLDTHFKNESKNATLVDYDEDDKSKLTYIIPSKLLSIIDKDTSLDQNDLQVIQKYNKVWSKYQHSASIGKVVRKLLPGKFPQVKGEKNLIEEFTNLVIAERIKKGDVFQNFRIVEGEDINKYYSSDYYSSEVGKKNNNLESSCMKYEHCYHYLDFYSGNKGVKLVILMSEEEDNKIIGRALLWDIEYIDGKNVDRKFMDRVYTLSDVHVELFKDYAKKHKWLHKERQNMNSDEFIVDTITGDSNMYILKTTPTFYGAEYYPYLDTLKYFYINRNYLSNSDDEYGDIYKLEGTEGGISNPEEHGQIFVDYYGDEFTESELIWCEYGQEWRLPEDAIRIDDEYATKDYADDNLIYSDLWGEYISNDDAIWSDYHDSYINRYYCVRFFKKGVSDLPFDEVMNIDDYDVSVDFVINNELHLNNFINYYRDDLYFSKDDLHNFQKGFSLYRYYNVEEKIKIYAHKKWDKDNIFRYDGKIFIDDLFDNEKTRDKIIGQTRISEKKLYNI